MDRQDRPVALVTGAGRSLGRAIAERLHANGYAVAVTDRDLDLASEVARGLDAGGSSASAYRLDVSVESEVAAVFEAVAADLGVPQALVNNAGRIMRSSKCRKRPGTWCRT